MGEIPERRRVARIIVPWHLSGCMLESREVRILDLSTLGVRIGHVEPLQPGASCTLHLPPSLGPVQVTARVVWSLLMDRAKAPEGEWRTPYQSGLAFIGLTGDQEDALAGVLRKLDAAAGKD